MAFDDFIEGFSNDELDALAARIRQNEISANREARLRELLEDVPMTDRQAAFEDKPAIVDVLVALGLEFDFPNGDLVLPEDEDEAEEEAAENGVEIREVDETRRRRGGVEGLPGSQGRETGVQPGDEVVRDRSRISNEVVRRDLGFERIFMDLLRDVGRCRQFDCFTPELYFRLTPEEQRKWYDMTPEGVLQWLVNRREITPSQLRARNFPEDVIPPEPE